MILANSELLSSIQGSIADRGQKSPDMDLMDAGVHTNSTQNFNTTLDETLAEEHSQSPTKASETPLKSKESEASEGTRILPPCDLSLKETQCTESTESNGMGARSPVSDTPVTLANIAGLAEPIARSEAPSQAGLETSTRQVVSGEKVLQASVDVHSQRSGLLGLSSAKLEQNVATVSDMPSSRSEAPSQAGLESSARFVKASAGASGSSTLAGGRSLADAATSQEQEEGILLEKKLVSGERDNRRVVQDYKSSEGNFFTQGANLKAASELRGERPANSKLSAGVADARPSVGLNPDSLRETDSKISEKSKPIARALDPVQAHPSLKISVNKLETEASSDIERPKIVFNSSLGERKSQDMRSARDSDMIELSQRALSPRVLSRTGLADTQIATEKDGQAVQAKDLGVNVSSKSDATQPRVPVGSKQAGVVDPANQSLVQVKVEEVIAARSQTIDALTSLRNQAVPREVLQKNTHRNQRKADDLALRAGLNVRSESLPAISDSRQSYVSLPSHVGQVAKFEASILEQHAMQEAKQPLEESSDELNGKSSRHETRFEKQAHSGVFLENSQSVGFSSAKTTVLGTPNNTSPLLMQRMVDTIQELKQSQNAQRVSFELDLAQGEKLKVRLHLSGDQVKSIFTTDSNTLKLLIRENWDQLQRQVEAEGLDLAQPDFADRNPQQTNDTDEQTAANEFFQADTKPSESLDHSKENSHGDTHSRDVAHADEHSEVVRYA